MCILSYQQTNRITKEKNRGGFLMGLTFEQIKSLIETDFFDIEQIKIIKAALENGENPKLHLTPDQLSQLAKIVQLDE